MAFIAWILGLVRNLFFTKNRQPTEAAREARERFNVSLQVNKLEQRRVLNADAVAALTDDLAAAQESLNVGDTGDVIDHAVELSESMDWDGAGIDLNLTLNEHLNDFWAGLGDAHDRIGESTTDSHELLAAYADFINSPEFAEALNGLVTNLFDSYGITPNGHDPAASSSTATTTSQPAQADATPDYQQALDNVQQHVESILPQQNGETIEQVVEDLAQNIFDDVADHLAGLTDPSSNGDSMYHAFAGGIEAEVVATAVQTQIGNLLNQHGVQPAGHNWASTNHQPSQSNGGQQTFQQTVAATHDSVADAAAMYNASIVESRVNELHEEVEDQGESAQQQVANAVEQAKEEVSAQFNNTPVGEALHDALSQVYDNVGIAPMHNWNSTPEPQHNWSSMAQTSTATTASTEIIFVDSRVTNYQELVDGARDGVEVVVLDPDRDGLEQIAEHLEGRDDIAAVHIVSHGSSGQLILGDSIITNENLDQYTAQLNAIGTSLTGNGDILFYGCDVGEGQRGADFLAAIAAATGADIAASTDDTGAAALGGDWDLEATVGLVNAGNAFTAETQANYNYILPAGSSVDLTFADGTLTINQSGDDQNDELNIRYDDTTNELIIEDDRNTLDATAIAGAGVSGDSGEIRIDLDDFAGTIDTIQVNGNGGDDELTVDFADGDFLAANNIKLEYDGGDNNITGPGDELIIDGNATFTSLTYDVEGAGEGSLSFDGTNSIDFEGLEPVVVMPVAGTVTINVDPGDAVAGTVTTTITSLGGGMNEASFTGGLESMTFMNPTVELIINGDAMDDDIITVTSVDAGFDAAVTIDTMGGGAVDDVININSALTLGSATSTGNVTLTSDDVNINQAIATGGGDVDIDATNDVTSTAAGSITTTAAADSAIASGMITIDSAVGAAGNTGNINLMGSLDTRGAEGVTDDGGDGGDVILDASNNDGGTITLATGEIFTGGGVSTFSGEGGANGDGGFGGNVTVMASGAVALTGVETSGGDGVESAGNGGDISIEADGMVTLSGTVETLGGLGDLGDDGNSGTVDITTTNGAISVNDIDASAVGAGAAGDIRLEANGVSGSVTLNGTVKTSGGTVTVDAAANIIDGSGDETANIDADSAELIAGTGVGSTAADGDIDVDTGNSTLAATTVTGDIVISDAAVGGATIGTVGSTTGITITGAGGGLIDVEATGGSLTVTQEVSNAGTATTSTIRLAGTGVDLAAANADVSATAGDINIEAGSGTFNMAAGSSVDTPADATITADDVTLNNSAAIGGATVTIQNNTSTQAINLGTNTDLGLTAAELDNITADTLIIGRNDTNAAGTITVSDQIDLTGNANTLILLTGANVVDGTGTEQTDLTVASLAIRAGDGIGTSAAGDIDIDVTTLAFVNSTTGDVFVTDTAGGLTINDVGGLTSSTNLNGGGAVAAASPLTISHDMTFGASMTLTAGNDAAVDNDDLTINNNAIVTIDSAVAGQVLRLEAGDDIIFDTGSARTVNAAHEIELAADLEGAGTDTDRGSVTQTGTAVSLTTDLLEIDAFDGIGDSSGDAGTTADNALRTTVTTLDLDNTGLNDILITETDGVDVNKIDQAALTGTVTLMAAGTITVVAAQSGVTSEQGNVTLTATGAASDVALNSAIITMGGDVDIDADNDVTSTAAGSITTTAAANSGVASGAVEIDTAGTGAVSLAGAIETTGADDDGTAGTASAAGTVDITTVDGSIEVAGITANGGMGTAGNANGGAAAAITLEAAGTTRDVTLNGELSALGGAGNGAGTAGAGATVVIDASGAVVDGNGAGNNVAASALAITATTGIGSADGIETAVTSLDATNTGAGSIEINETDAIVLSDVDTANGAITITAGGTITATDVQSLTDNDANDISLSTTAGDIEVGAIVATGAGDVMLDSAGAITDGRAGEGAGFENIIADQAALRAATGIGTTTGDEDIDINVTTLAFVNSTTGDVVITDTAGGLTVNDVDGLTASTNVNGGGAIAAASPLTISHDMTFGADMTFTAGNDAAMTGDDLTIRDDATVTLDSDSDASLTFNAGDNIVFGSTGPATTGQIVTMGLGTHTVSLNADQEMDDGDGAGGSVRQTATGFTAVTTDDLIITARTGVGSSSIPLEIDVVRLDVTNTTSGSIHITDVGTVHDGLTLDQLDGDANNRAVDAANSGGQITAESPMTISANVLVGASMTFTAGNDAAAADDDLTINNNAVVTLNSGVANQVLRFEAGDDIIFDTGSAETTGADHEIELAADLDGAGDGDRGSVTQTGTSVSLTTALLEIDAFDGIGDSSGDAGTTADNALRTTVATLDVDNTGMNDILITETDGVDVNKFDQAAVTGAVTLMAAGTITVAAAQSGVSAEEGKVTLTATGAASNVAINSAITTMGGDVDIDAGNNVTSTAAGSITTTAAADSGTNSGNITIDAAVGAALNTGNIDLLGELDTQGADNSAGDGSDGGDVSLNAANNDGGTITLATGEINTSGGEGTGGDGGDGGEVTVMSTGAIMLTNIDSTGNDGTDDFSGNGGDVTIDSTGGTVTVGTIDARGGEGADEGGSGGNVNVMADGAIGVTEIVTSSGDNDASGVGGPAGDVDITSDNGTVSIGDITAEGGSGDDNGADGGNVTIDADGMVTVTGTIETLGGEGDVSDGNSGTVDITTTNGAISVNDIDASAVDTGTAGDVTLDANGASGSVTLNGTVMTTGGTVIIDAATNIVDGSGDETANIVATDLAMTAATGIGASDDIDTEVGTVAFTNSSGEVNISNDGGLTIDDVNGITTSTSAGGGSVAANSPMTISHSVTVNASMTFTAGNDNTMAGDDLTINSGAVVTLDSATNGVLTFNAGDDILIATDTGARIVTQGGGTHTVLLQADLDADAAEGSVNQTGGANAVTTDTLDIDADNGIGNTGALQVVASSLSADTTNGDIDIDNAATASVTATSLSTGTGGIEYDQTGNQQLTLTSVMTTDGGVTITNSGGTGADILVGSIATDTTDDTVSLTGDEINDSTADTTTDITAFAVVLNASNGIGNSADIDLAARSISADTLDGDIDINNVNAMSVTVTSLTTGTIVGANDPDNIEFNQSGGGSLTFTGPVSSGTDPGVDGGSITLNNLSGELTIGAGATVSSQDNASNTVATLTIGNATINGAIDLGAGDITIQGGGDDTIIDSATNLEIDGNLGLTANRDVIVRSVIDVDQVAGSGGDLMLTADTDGDGDGGVLIDESGSANDARVLAEGNVTATGSDLFNDGTPGNAGMAGDTQESVRVEADTVAATTQIEADGTISLLSGANAPTGVGGADIEISGRVVTTAGGTITVAANDDIVITDTTAAGTLQTSGMVDLTASAGSIVDGDTGTETSLVVASSIVMRAETGIGDGTGGGGDIETATDAGAGTLTLAAITDSGDINIRNAGSLTIGTVDGLSGVEIQDTLDDNSGGDDITLVAASPLTVNDDVIDRDGGDIRLLAITDGDVTINANVQVTDEAAGALIDGAIFVIPDAGNIIHNTGTVSTVGTGEVRYNAAGAGGGMNDGGFVTIGDTDTGNDAAEITTENGNIDIDGDTSTANTTGVTIADDNGDALVSTTSGMITIDGTGFGDGTVTGIRGVDIGSGSTVESTGSGAAIGMINITGTGGEGMGEDDGVRIAGVGTAVTSVDGDIAITGTSTNDDGVEISGGALVASTGEMAPDAATISITGTSTSTADNADGVIITGTGTTVRSIQGNVTIDGESDGDDGVEISDNASIFSDDDEDLTNSDSSIIATANIDITGTSNDTTSLDDGVLINTNARVLSQQDGDITITGTSAGGDGVDISNGAQVLSDDNADPDMDDPDVTSTGTIEIDGTSTGVGDGVDIKSMGTRVSSAEQGDITIDGTGIQEGVTIANGAVVDSPTTDAGSAEITIQGTSSATTGNGRKGVAIVALTGTGTTVMTAASDADIVINGTAGGGGSFNIGVEVSGLSVVTATGGDITITGTQGGLPTGSRNDGIEIRSGADISGKGGTVTLTGIGGAVTATNDNDGVQISGAGTTVMAGTLDIDGTGNGTTTGNDGVEISAGATVTVSSGIDVIGIGGSGTDDNNGILITGTGTRVTDNSMTPPTIDMDGTGMGTGSDNDGIEISGGAIVEGTDAAMVQLDGTGSAAGTGTDNDGVEISGNDGMGVSSTVSSVNGDITITGTAGDGTNDNTGVEVSDTAQVISTAASITITGTQGVTPTGDNNDGILIASDADISGTGGMVTLTGIGGGTDADNDNDGVQISGTGTTVMAGTLDIDGTGDGQDGGTNNEGVELSGGAVVTVTGTANVSGTGGSPMANSNNHGVLISENPGAGPDTSLTAGALTITGIAMGDSNIDGVLITGDGTTVMADSADIDGTATLAGGNSNGDGVEISAGAVVTISGTAMVDGTGTGGEGGNNDGVFINGMNTEFNAGTATIQGTGFAGATGASDDTGVEISGGAAVTIDNAAIINGTGGGNNSEVRNDGVLVTGNGTQLTTGDLTITGSGRGERDENTGVEISNMANVMVTGTAMITGTGRSDDGDDNNDGVRIASDADVTITGTATIIGIGGGTDSVTDNNGVIITGTGTTLDANGLTITGTGNGTGANNDGVEISAGATVTVAEDSIEIDGTGGANGTDNNNGILITGMGTRVTDNSMTPPTIDMDGTGMGTGSDNDGIEISGGAIVEGTDAAMVQLDGTGSAAGTGTDNDGVEISGNDGMGVSSTVSSVNGDITITGTAGDGTDDNTGVEVSNTAQVTSTAANITITGTQGVDPTGDNNDGILIASDADISGTGGNLTLSGTGGGAMAFDDNDGIQITGTGTTVTVGGTASFTGTGSGTNNDNDGVEISTEAVVTITGTATLTGTGAGNANNDGVLITGTGTSLTANELDIDGTGDGSTNLNDGVEISSSATVAGTGLVDIAGTGGSTDADNNNDGVIITTGADLDAGTLNITGSGLGNVDDNDGVEISADADVDATGNITIIGTGTGIGMGEAADDNDGVVITGTGTTVTGSGTASFTGSGSGNNNDNDGVEISDEAVVTITGTATLTGNGDGNANNDGVLITGTGTSLTANELDIDGIGDGSTNLNDGVEISASATVAGTGLVDISGTGGSTDADNNNDGVIITTGADLDAGTLNITGSGLGNVDDNDGVEISANADVDATGNITIIGTGTGIGMGETADDNDGVVITETGTTVTGSGTASFTGSGSGNNNDNDGVEISAEAVVTITGTATLTGTGDGNANNDGVLITGTNTSLTANELNIDGTGDGSTNQNDGVEISASATVAGTGLVDISGTGGSAAADNNNDGVIITTGADLDAGTLNITGSGDGTGTDNDGVEISAAATATASSGIDIDGTGGANGTDDNRGVLINGAGTIVTHTGMTGAIDIDGTSMGSGSGNDGVQISSNALVNSTGTAPIQIDGTGSAAATGNDNNGVLLAVSEVRSIDGDVTIVGTGGGTGILTEDNRGVFVNFGTVRIDGTADVIINGTAGEGIEADGRTQEGVFLNNSQIGDDSEAFGAMDATGDATGFIIIDANSDELEIFSTDVRTNADGEGTIRRIMLSGNQIDIRNGEDATLIQALSQNGGQGEIVAAPDGTPDILTGNPVNVELGQGAADTDGGTGGDIFGLTETELNTMEARVVRIGSADILAPGNTPMLTNQNGDSVIDATQMDVARPYADGTQSTISVVGDFTADVEFGTDLFQLRTNGDSGTQTVAINPGSGVANLTVDLAMNNPGRHFEAYAGLDITQEDADVLTATGDAPVMGGGGGMMSGFSDGSLDPTFDGTDGPGDGRIVLDDDFPDFNGQTANRVLQQPDGNLLVVGSNDSFDSFVVVRLLEADGTYDTTFAGDGTLEFNDGSDLRGARDAAFMVDGGGNLTRIVVVGNDDSGSFSTGAVKIALLNPDGTLDTAFGTAGNGFVTTDPSVFDPVGNPGQFTDFEITAVSVDDMGRIVVAGSVQNSATNSRDFAVIRYNADGSIDTTFGDFDGLAIADFAGGAATFDVINEIAIDASGNIVAVGSAEVAGFEQFGIARFDSTGTLDATFDGDGLRATAIRGTDDSRANDVVIQPDGSIVVAGVVFGADSDFAVVRYTTTGGLDATFDGDGILTVDVSGTNDFDGASGVDLQSDGRVVVSGTIDFEDFAVIRLTTTGGLDNSFDGDGIVVTSFNGEAFSTDVVVQQDQRIVAAGADGFFGEGTVLDFALARYAGDDGNAGNQFTGDDDRDIVDIQPTSVDGEDPIFRDGDVHFFAERMVSITNTSTIETEDGEITLRGNQQTPATSGTFDGVTIFQSRVTTGTDTNVMTAAPTVGGNILIEGRSGDNAAAGGQDGVFVTLSTIESLRQDDTGDIDGNGIIEAGSITIAGTSVASDGNSDGVLIFGMNTFVNSVDGNIDIDGTSNGTSSFNSGVSISNAAQVNSLGMGEPAANITIDGTGGLGTSGNRGVQIFTTDAAVNSIDGDITITGTGRGDTTNGTSSNDGVSVRNTADVNATGDGNITLVGTGNTGTAGDRRDNEGVSILGVGTTVTTVSGDIDVDGTGANGGTLRNEGISVSFGALVGSTTGNITLDGTGGNSEGDSDGVEIANTDTRVTNVLGNITITGTAGSDMTAGSDSNRGVQISGGAVVDSTGMDDASMGETAGTITITGTGGAGEDENDGVFIDGAMTMVTSIDGDITIDGTGNRGNIAGVTQDDNNGVRIDNGAVISSTGVNTVDAAMRTAANIDIDGRGAFGDDNNRGVFITGMDTNVTADEGNITIDGTGGTNFITGGNDNHGVEIGSGAVVDTTSTGMDVGNVTITGTGRGDSDNEGVRIHSTGTFVRTIDGDIMVTGSSSGFGDENEGVDIELGAVVRTTGTGDDAGNITVKGKGSGSNSNEGVQIDGMGTTVDVVDGDIMVVGRSEAFGDNNEGVEIQDQARVESTGVGMNAGTITLDGIGTGFDDSEGVRIEGASTIVTSVDGDIVIRGDSIGSNDNNEGVDIEGGAEVSSTGMGDMAANITIHGFTGVCDEGEGGGVPINDSEAVLISGTDTQVRTLDGDIEIVGINNSTGINNAAVEISSGAVVGSAIVPMDPENLIGDGTITISGLDNNNNFGDPGVLIDGPDTMVRTNTGIITITAAALNDNSQPEVAGNLQMNLGGQVVSDEADIYLNSTNDVRLGIVNANFDDDMNNGTVGDAPAGTVFVVADAPATFAVPISNNMGGGGEGGGDAWICMDPAMTETVDINPDGFGAIADNLLASEDPNITAAATSLVAADGIGTGIHTVNPDVAPTDITTDDGDIDTSVSILAAFNGSNLDGSHDNDGNINIENHGGQLLTLNTVGTTIGVQSDAAGGNISILNNSPLNIGPAGITNNNGGNITITAAAPGGDLGILGSVFVNGGLGIIQLNGGDSVSFGAGNTIRTDTVGSIIDINAINGNVTGDFTTLATTTVIQTVEGVAVYGKPFIGPVTIPQIDILGMTSVTSVIGRPGETNLKWTIDWGDGTVDVINVAQGGLSQTAFHTYTANPSPNPADPIPISMTVEHVDSIQVDGFVAPTSTTIDFTIRGFLGEATVPGTGFGATVFQFASNAPALSFPEIATATGLDSLTETSTTEEIDSGDRVVASESTAADDEKLVLRLKLPSGDTKDFPLPNDILEGDNVKLLWKRLTDGRYQIVLIREDGTERIVLTVEVRGGRAIIRDNTPDVQQEPKNAGENRQEQNQNSGGEAEAANGEAASNEMSHADDQDLPLPQPVESVSNSLSEENTTSPAERVEAEDDESDEATAVEGRRTVSAAALVGSAIAYRSLRRGSAANGSWEELVEEALASDEARSLGRAARLRRQLLR